MEVLAALGDAATAAIAVLAILLGVLLVARGPREKRVNGATEQPGPTLLRVPVSAAPDAEPGFVGPEGTVVGHGPIRLGGGGPLGAGAPAAPGSAPAPEPPAAPEPAAEVAPAAEPEPAAEVAPAPEPEPAAEPDPPQAATDPAAPPAEEAPPQQEDASAPKEPAWRVAARAANSGAHFRQGAIKLGGKPARREDD